MLLLGSGLEGDSGGDSCSAFGDSGNVLSSGDGCTSVCTSDATTGHSIIHKATSAQNDSKMKLHRDIHYNDRIQHQIRKHMVQAFLTFWLN